MSITTVANFRLPTEWNRAKVHAGVIPCVWNGREWLFAFGVDAGHQEISDFGGHLEPADATFIEGALRELDEESLGVFGKWQPEILGDCPVFVGWMRHRPMVNVLLPMVGEASVFQRQFRNNRLTELFKPHQRNNPRLEMSDLVWLTETELMETNPRVWKLYRKYIQKFRPLSRFLKI